MALRPDNSGNNSKKLSGRLTLPHVSLVSPLSCEIMLLEQSVAAERITAAQRIPLEYHAIILPEAGLAPTTVQALFGIV
jgi:hypothetical protein